jgi:hypothetical protein
VFVSRAVAAVDRVCAIAERAARERHVILFKPTDPVNPMCDVCAVLPCAAAIAASTCSGSVRCVQFMGGKYFQYKKPKAQIVQKACCMLLPRASSEGAILIFITILYF